LLTIDGKTVTIGTGQWYHVPAEKEHSAEFSEDTCEIEFWFKS
jgi:quercetin dioxygenase-like cupin family protein